MAPASGSSNQVSIFQDDNQLQSNPGGTLANLRLLRDQVVKVTVSWEAIAPDPNSRRQPRGFHPANPAAYPPANWAIYDEIDRDAHADGVQVYCDLDGGGPRWAEEPGRPAHPSSHPGWAPSPRAFEAFTHAVGARYDGTYTPAGASTPLPRVSFWSIWNEPNLGAFLSPQGVPGDLSVENSGHLYRNLLEAAWAGLQQTGHGEDTILIGELAGGGQAPLPASPRRVRDVGPAKPAAIAGHAVWMASVANINDVLEGYVALEVECVDRLYLNAYVPNLQVGGQVVRFLCRHLGLEVPSPALFGRIGNRFRREVKAFAAEHGIPILALKKPDRSRWDDRKLDHVGPYLEAAEREGRFGVVAIVACQEFQWVICGRNRPPNPGGLTRVLQGGAPRRDLLLLHP